MKILRKSNFNHEDHRGDQYFVAENIKSKYHAKLICEALNAIGGEQSDDYFIIVEDDYKLPPPWEP